MKLLIGISLLISINSYAGVEVQRCTTEDRVGSIRLCIEWNRLRGKLDFESNSFTLRFSDEENPKASFELSDQKRTGSVQIFESRAILQMVGDEPIVLSCGAVMPGNCH